MTDKLTGGPAGAKAPTGPGDAPAPRGPAPAPVPQGERLLGLGDRIPNFMLPDPQGELRLLYQAIAGWPSVLLLAANTAMQDQWDEIKGFAAAAPALHAAGVRLMIVSNDGIESLAMVAKIIPEHAHWLADIKGVVNLGLRQGALFAFTGAVCFVLDSNQRIVGVRAAEPGHADWALAMLKARPGDSPQRLSTTAPILLLPAVLDGEDCAALLKQISDANTPGGSAAIADKALAERIVRILLRRIGPEVEKAFSFDDFVFESLVLRWDDSAAPADRRTEVDDPAVQGRSFSLIVDLAGEAYEGGDILFPEYGPHSYRPGSGGALVFAGTLLRELRPVSAGRRSLLVATLRRPKAEAS
jgi:hypothetical protein